MRQKTRAELEREVKHWRTQAEIFADAHAKQGIVNYGLEMKVLDMVSGPFHLAEGERIVSYAVRLPDGTIEIRFNE